MTRALLDTDIFSEYLKGHDSNVRRHAAAYRLAHGQLCVTVVTVMEVVKGLHRVGRESQVQLLLSLLALKEVIDFDCAAGELAGRIHADLERAGQPIGWADTVIAAIALRHDRELVSGNLAHYERIRQLGYPLRLANWRVA
jgi:predicted nucleic acid-binding protein